MGGEDKGRGMTTKKTGKTKTKLRKKPTICLAMIARNEENFIARALESAKLVCDRMVVVDTGSTDNTMRIARECGAEVIESPWQDSFSQARNVSLAAVREDWALILDADDELDVNDIPRLLKCARDKKANCWNFPNISLAANGKQQGRHYNARLFRPGAGYRYHGRVHNQLINANGTMSTEFSVDAEVKIYHYGYALSPEDMKKKWLRTARLLELHLADVPNDGYQHYNYAVINNNLGNDEKCRSHAERAIKLYKPRLNTELGQSITIMSLYMVAVSLQRGGEIKEAIEKCREALKINGEFPDALFKAGELLGAKEGTEREAIDYLLKYLNVVNRIRLKPYPNRCLLNTMEMDWLAFYQIGQNYFNLAVKANGEDATVEWAESTRFMRRAIAAAPDGMGYPELKRFYFRLGFAHMQLGEYHEGIDVYRSVAKTGEQDPEIYHNIGVGYQRLGNTMKAREYFEQALKINPKYSDSTKAIEELQGGLVAAD